MTISPLKFIQEKIRQGVTQDENFYRRMLYYFELQIIPLQSGPGPVTGLSSSFFFPLILPPTSISLGEPFAVELTPTQRGGLYAEENGIIQRPLKIKGNTGFKPRKLKTFGAPGGSGPPGPSTARPLTSPQTVSYSRELPCIAALDISGHRHFQYLQDSVFRTYADLKRDPVTAADTRMFFHNPKDDEHWAVIPNNFALDRDASSPILYNYSIDLTIIGKADAPSVDLDFDDKSILDILNNALYIASLGANTVEGAVNDLTALNNDISTSISNINLLIDDVENILSATQDFVDGNEDFIDLQYSAVQTAMELAEEVVGLFSDPNNPEFQESPPSVTNMFRKMIDGLEMIATNPSSFRPTNEKSMSNMRDHQELRRTVTQEKQTEIEDGAGPTSYAELDALGTGMTPGEITASKGIITAGGEIKKFKNAQKVKVSQGDTLGTLSAQYLGDARLWQYIAIANGIKPPYVDDMASTPLDKGSADEILLGFSLGIGADILIPSNTAAPTDYPSLPVLGSTLDESMDNQLLGVDALLEVSQGTGSIGDGNVLWDVAVNTELGSTDIKLAEGLDNIIQVIQLRIQTEHRSDPMYTKVGMKRIIGLNFLLADLENARYRVRETVGADSRIANVKDLKFDQVEDGLDINMDAVLRGFSESQPIQLTVQG